MEAEAEASSSLSSVPHLRPHTDKASTFRHSDEGLQTIKKQKWDMYFPIELITNIIARLPVKTLLRFRVLSSFELSMTNRHHKWTYLEGTSISKIPYMCQLVNFSCLTVQI